MVFSVVSRLIGRLFGLFQLLDRLQPLLNDIHMAANKAVAVAMHCLLRFDGNRAPEMIL